MRYHNQKILDLDSRILKEYESAPYAYIISAEINEDTIQKICEKCDLDKDKDINKITSYVIDNYVSTVKKKLKRSVKRCLLVIKQTKFSKLKVYGIIYEKDIEKIQKLWKYGNIEISPVENIIGFIKTFVRVYKKDLYFKKIYASYLFGSQCYEQIKKQIEQIKIPLLEDEFFKEIPFFNGYYISNYARVISKKRHKETLLKPQNNQFRKLCVTLYANGKLYKKPLGFIMGKTFFDLDFYPKNHQIFHKDGDLNNNILSNLEIKLIDYD